jgi:hypothetical protein
MFSLYFYSSTILSYSLSLSRTSGAITGHLLKRCSFSPPPTRYKVPLASPQMFSLCFYSSTFLPHSLSLGRAGQYLVPSNKMLSPLPLKPFRFSPKFSLYCCPSTVLLESLSVFGFKVLNPSCFCATGLSIS